MQGNKVVKPPKKKKMIYTPKHHIPIGEVVDTDDGRKAIRIKKPGEKETDDVSIEYLVSAVMNTENA